MRFFLCLLALFSLALFVNATVQQRSNRRGSDNRPEGLPRGSNNRGTNNNRETNNNGPGNDNQSPPRRGGGPGQTRLRRDVGIFPDSDVNDRQSGHSRSAETPDIGLSIDKPRSRSDQLPYPGFPQNGRGRAVPSISGRIPE